MLWFLGLSPPNFPPRALGSTEASALSQPQIPAQPVPLLFDAGPCHQHLRNLTFIVLP